MKKSFIMTISLVSVLAICMAVFAACGKKHNFSKTYTYNNEYHWRACTDKDCKEVKDKAKHTYGKWEVTKKPTATEKGERTRYCTVCKKKHTEEIAALQANPVTLKDGVMLDKKYDGKAVMFTKEQFNFMGNEKNTAEIERTISQIESLEAEYQKSFDENAALWEKYFAEFQKLDEIPENFDERAFIKELKTLTDDEKTALLKNVDALDALDEKLDKLYDELYDKDDDVLYNDCKDGSCDFPGNGCGEYDVLFIECDENCFAENCGK